MNYWKICGADKKIVVLWLSKNFDRISNEESHFQLESFEMLPGESVSIAGMVKNIIQRGNTSQA
jgi:hypothetical protein